MLGLGRPVRLLGSIFALALQREVAHRADFLAQFVLTLLATAATGGVLAAVYANVERLAGWTLGEAVVLLGTYLVIHALLQTFIEPNLQWFRGRIWEGALDDALLKPVSGLFLASFSMCRPFALVDAVVGLALVGVGIGLTPDGVGVEHVLGWVLLVATGTTVAWAVRLLLGLVAFWAPGLELSVFFGTVWQMSRFPIDVYGRALRAVLTYVIPLAFVANFPARTLARGPDSIVLIGGLAAAVGAIAVTRATWSAGIRRYTSATS